MLRQSKSIYQKKKTVNKHTCTVIYLPLEESNMLPYVSTVSMYSYIHHKHRQAIKYGTYSTCKPLNILNLIFHAQKYRAKTSTSASFRRYLRSVICKVVLETLFSYVQCMFIHLYIQDGTPLGSPSRVENVGETQLPYSVFLDYVLSLAETKYR